MPAFGPQLLASCSRLVEHLASKNDVLLLTTSNRYEKHVWDVPKTTQLARRIEEQLKERRKRVTLLDVASLRIHTCEGNISGGRGNNCGPRDAKLPDKRKNPTGHHRCWASINNKDDELYKVSRELFRSQAVVFFVSIRWGQTNSVYQRLFERLSWIENRVTTLGEKPIPQLKNLEAGIVVFGHNWNGQQVLQTQKKNFEWFGWKTPAALSFSWQYTRDAKEESRESYCEAIEEFGKLVQLGRPRKPKTIDDYLKALPADRREALEKLRRTIKAIVPDAEECISYSMPAFRVDGRVIAGFQATSKGCSYYPFSGRTLATLAADVAAYDQTKGALHFDPKRSLPKALLRKLLEARLAEKHERALGL